MTKKNHITLHFLDKYTKNTVVSQPISEGVAFSQKGNRNKKKYEHYDKEVWKDKKWYNWRKIGHSASHCQRNSKENPNKNQDEKNSRTSRSIKSSSSNKSDINKLNKVIKKYSTTLEDKIGELENEDSDLTSSDSEDSGGYSHF